MKRLTIMTVALAMLGCGVEPGRNPDPVQVSGRVMIQGRPVTDVVFNLQATGPGVQATYPIKNGMFQGAVVPGRYTYFISEGANAAAFKVIPSKYHLGSLERQIDIDANTTKLEFALES